MRTSVLGLGAALSAVSLPCLLAGCSGAPGSPEASSSSSAVTEKCGEKSSGPVQGVDVSDYQGSFDWAKAHVQFGYAQVSDGLHYKDWSFSGNWSRMKSAGVLRGAYQYFEPSQDATEQANLVVAAVGKLGEGDLPAMIDVEDTDGLSGSEIGSRVKTWLEVVEKGTGLKPIIYTGSYFWEDNVGTDLASYPIWIAAYGVSCPSLPHDGWSNWTFWQYSDGGGSLDHDVFNGSLSQLKALSGAPSGPPTPKPEAPTGCGEIKAGQGLVSGQSYKSCDGRMHLDMQSDGNFVLYLGSMALWASGTYGKGGYVAVMQNDGNLVVYGKESNPLWASHTNGHSDLHLSVQDDGNLVVYGSTGHVYWAAGSNLPGSPSKPTACGVFEPGQGLTAGESWKSCDGRFSIDMQTDGNLVLYEAGKGALWATGTNKERGYKMIMQTDGNFVEYDINGKAVWASGTYGHDGSHLSVQDDGNLVVYEPGDKAIWASHTCCH